MKQRLAKTGILLFCILILLAVLRVAQPSCVFAQEKSLYVLYSGINANYLSLWLAKDAHYFADEGLTVQAVHIRGAAPVVQNLMAGQSQVGMIGATVVATAAIQGNKDVVMIGGVTNVMALRSTRGQASKVRKPSWEESWLWPDSAEPPTSLSTTP